MYPGINGESKCSKRYSVLDDSFLMGPPTDIKRLWSDGGPPGSWDSLCLFLSSCSIVNCSKPLLFQHLTNTVCRPTKHTHTHTHAATKFSLFPSCFLPVGIRKFPPVSGCNKTHPAGEKAADFKWRFLIFLFSLCSQVSAGAGGACGKQGGPGGGEGGVPKRGPGAGRGLGLPLHGDVGQEQDHGGRAVRGDREADGLLPPARPKRGVLPRLQRSVAAKPSAGGVTDVVRNYNANPC